MQFLLFFLLASCSTSSYRKIEKVHGPVVIDSTWKEVAFEKDAESVFLFNEVLLETDGQYDFHPDSGIVEAKSGKRTGIQVKIVSKGGQEFDLKQISSQSGKENSIVASGDGMQTSYVGNKWSKVKLRSDSPIQLKSISWYSYDPTKVER